MITKYDMYIYVPRMSVSIIPASYCIINDKYSLHLRILSVDRKVKKEASKYTCVM